MKWPAWWLVAALFVAFALGVGVGAGVWLSGVHVGAMDPIALADVYDSASDAVGTTASTR